MYQEMPSRSIDYSCHSYAGLVPEPWPPKIPSSNINSFMHFTPTFIAAAQSTHIKPINFTSLFRFLTFNDSLFPENCTNSEYEDICSRMVSIELLSGEYTHTMSVYTKFAEMGLVEKSKVGRYDSGRATLKIVYAEIESVFRLLRTHRMREFDFHVHVMDLDQREEDIEIDFEQYEYTELSDDEEDDKKPVFYEKQAKLKELVVNLEERHCEKNMRINKGR